MKITALILMLLTASCSNGDDSIVIPDSIAIESSDVFIGLTTSGIV